MNYTIDGSEGSEPERVTPEEFSSRILGPLSDPEHIPTKAEIGTALENWRQATYGHGYAVSPDAQERREAEDWYASVAGVPLHKLAGDDRDKALSRVGDHAAQVAQEKHNGVLKSISGRIAAASQRHDDQWAAHDSEVNGSEYEKAIEELDAESSKLDARSRLQDKIMSIGDPERRAAWVERFPAIFAE